MSRDTFLAGVRRALEHTDDDRVLRRAVLDEVRRHVPFDAFAWLLTDPVTIVGTSPLAEVPCPDQLPRLIALRYLSGRRWTSGQTGVPSRPVVPGSDLDGFLTDLGVRDVVSLVFADRFGWWGFLDLWRTDDRFGAGELELLGLLGSPVTSALREARAAALAPSRTTRRRPAARAVVVLGPDLVLRRGTAEADGALRALLPTDESRRPVPAAAFNVAAQLLAREAGVDAHPARAMSAVGPGEWICLDAARLGAECSGDIAVSLGPLDPRERQDLFCRAHGLTAREAEVAAHLADGEDTRTVAAHLRVSEHTVQDHLKSVFAKTGVSSRRELLAHARGD